MLNQSLNTLGRLAKGSKAYAASDYATVANTASTATTVVSAAPAAITLGSQLKEFADKINDNNVNSKDIKEFIETVLRDNGSEVKALIDPIALDWVRNSIINNITDENLKALVDAVLQNDGKLAKEFINLVASNQLRDLIINSIDDQNLKALVETALQDNGKVAKRAIDLVASDGQLKNAVFEDINGENPGKAVEKIMGAVMQAINDTKNGEKPSTFLGILNEHKGKIAISVLFTGGAVTAFVLGQPIIGAIAAVVAVIAVGVLISEVYKQQSASKESVPENDNKVGSVLSGMTSEPLKAAGQRI